MNLCRIKDNGETGITTKSKTYTSKQEVTRNIRLRRLQWSGPRIEDEGRKGAKESSERIHRRDMTGSKAQRKMERGS